MNLNSEQLDELAKTKRHLRNFSFVVYFFSYLVFFIGITAVIQGEYLGIFAIAQGIWMYKTVEKTVKSI